MTNFDVDKRTILKVRHGSHAYGLATPNSDIDEKGVCIEPKAYHLGYLQKFEQSERYANKGHECDSVIYSLKKFVNLAADNNPNIIEVLHGDVSDILKIDSFGEKLIEYKDEFLSKKAMHTFLGYSHAQIKRMKSHRSWLLNPPTHNPTRAEFGLPENPIIPSQQLEAAQSAVNKKLQHWNFENMQDISPDLRILIQGTIAELMAEVQISVDTKWASAARNIGFNENFLELLDKERKYKNSKIYWDQYNEWKLNRNPARSKMEEESGFDRKHASHAIRLSRMCQEILQGKGVIVKRPDAEELLAIKLHGIWTYDQVVEEVERLQEECKELYKISPLPHGPNRNKLDDLVISLTEEYLQLYG